MTTTPGNLMGQSVLRVEDTHLLRGEGTFVGNVDLDGALVAHFVTSIHAHARIIDVDVSAARSMPGVVDVVTAADVTQGFVPGSPPNYPPGTARPLLAADRVRFVGEAIVAIVAETAGQAADAAELVVVSYEPLPVLVDLAAAEASEVLLFPELGTNVMVTETMGDELDFSDCEVVVEGEFVNQRLAACPLETRVAASVWSDDGHLLHYASCQGVHPLQKGLMAYYGLSQDRVRVVTSDVGGSFGAKARFHPEELAIPLLAQRARRPVRWIPTRSMDMTGLNHSRAQRHYVKIGGDQDGTIKAWEVHVLGDCGAYPIAGPALARNACMVLPGPFRVPRHRWSYTTVVTNTTPTGAYRGAGRPEGGAHIDRAADLFAAEIGMDPLELRRRNLRRADELPYTNVTGLFYDSGDYHEALELMASEVGYDDLKAEQQRRREAGETKLLGIGLSTFIDRTAGVPGAEYGAVEVLADGTFRVYTGSSPYGQGHYTTWAMLVSERTGVPMDRIQVIHGDTDLVPRGGITGGSRSAQKAGTAVAIAADNLVDEARRQAADLLEAAPADIVLDVTSGQFHVAGSPAAASLGWVEIGTALVEKASDPDHYRFKCETDYEPEGPTVPYGAYAAVVEVDVETGAVELQRLVSVDDAGTILNPMIALGQVHGGIGQAIGQALYEEFVYDVDGNPLTGTFLDYAFPSAAEMPSFESHLTENPSPQNPLGFKGIAESGTIGGVPAVQNAVIDALAHLGVRHIDLPVTPQRVWAAINQS
ncbi:MAG: xanthine dehydrogenase family protein molybdopterin-binding subunit [Actinomycetota bacterium]|nr:xanthine dehydrogenase family protein molybdopterin-binding subunit [Actinomycetota bacterium]